MDDGIAALRDEGEDLDRLVPGLTPEQWRTPHAGGRLDDRPPDRSSAVDRRGGPARHRRPRWRSRTSSRRRAGLRSPSPTTTAAERAAWPPATLLSRWRDGRDRLAAALAEVPSDARIAWFGPPMKPRSMVTARLMETWAHGQDVADALGVARTPTARLRDVAHLGVRTRDFAYLRQQPHAPGRPVPHRARRTRTGADGRGAPRTRPAGSSGSAEAFCLVVTQRRELGAVDLTVEGADAARWMTIAQAFAGAPKAVVRAALDERTSR